MAELPKTYDPKTVEPDWYARWLKANAFRADAMSSKPPFSIVIPPPNVTGMLTLGHVLNTTIQDILCRRARMRGCEVLWLPGMDHAGIGTQTAVEKWLRKNEDVTRHDLGRDEFIRRVWTWKEKHGGIIIEQLKRLGCSCDWSRERFTLDEKYARAVQQVFVDLYQKGMIYKGRRMINWDRSRSLLSPTKKSYLRRPKAHCFMCATNSWINRENIWKSLPRGQKRLWLMSLWRFIQAIRATTLPLAKKCGDRLRANRFPSSPTKRSIRNSAPEF